MREIKFRIWDKKYNLMHLADNYAWVDMYIDSLGKIIELEHVYEGNDEKNDVSNDYILMQYTGLKDKNGKEVYEDDLFILKGIVWHLVWNEVGFRWEIITRNIYNTTSQTYLYKSIRWLKEKSFEVKGNTYENPELLTS